MSIRNFVFDMGNVLLRYDVEEMLQNLCETDEERAVMRCELFQSETWLAGDAGEISESEKFEKIKPNVPPQFHTALQNCCAHWGDFMKPLPGAIDFCREAKQKGYHLFVLSNASDAFSEIFPREMPTDLFDGLLYSAQVKLLKPDVKIYRRLLEKFSLTAEECVFFDDIEANAAGARLAGMQAVCFDGDFEKLRKEWLS